MSPFCRVCLACVLVGVAVAWACDRDGARDAVADSSDAGASGAVNRTSGDPASAADLAAPGVEPVPHARLVELCGKEVAGWTLKDVVGDEHPLGAGRITSALATYSRERDGKPQALSLGIIDGARAPQAYLAFDVAWKTELSNESLGYTRFEFGRDRVVQMLSRHPLTVQIHALVANRFLVQVDAEKIEPEDARDFVMALPLDLLRAWK